MRRRILVLTGYFGRNLLFSLAGSIYLILALAYWRIFFDPGQGTPHAEYYILVIGAFGAAITFLSALTVTARANQMANYPLVVRLPSRVEYLTAVFLSTLFFGTLLQLLIAALALLNGPAISLGRALEIPPIWLAFNILASILAMHASDFVAAGWSRVYIFGILAVFLFGQSTNDTASKWLAARISNLSLVLFEEGFSSMSNGLNSLANWLSQSGSGSLSRVFSLLFWPFKAVADATIQGVFNPTQALAPAIILLYAAILFVLAADLFATKDLDFTE